MWVLGISGGGGGGVLLFGLIWIVEEVFGGFGWIFGCWIIFLVFVFNICWGNIGGLVVGLYLVFMGICLVGSVLNEFLGVGGMCIELEEKGGGIEMLLVVCIVEIVWIVSWFGGLIVMLVVVVMWLLLVLVVILVSGGGM